VIISRLLMRHKVLFFLLFLLLLIPIQSVFAQEITDGAIYVVDSGDTLTSIAILFGIPMNDILSANDIADANAINIGTRLIIPGLDGINGTLVKQIVPLGDDFNSISLKYRLDKHLLSNLNRITSPQEVYAGTRLIVPSNTTVEELSAAAVVGHGQSFLEIAALTNNNTWDMASTNDRTSTWDMLPGEIIYAPLDDTQSTGMRFNPYITDLSIAPLPIVQGKTSVIKITTIQPMQLTGSLAGKQLHFFENSDNEYVALAGIHAMHETGLEEIQLTGTSSDGVEFHINQQIYLAPGNFNQEAVDGVDANTIDSATIENEDGVLTSLLSIEPQRFWSSAFRFPVDEPCMASRFGNRRSYNQGSYYYFHTGLDFTVCAPNLNIYASAPGKVLFTGPLPIKGNFTIIDHGWGVYTGYAHQSQVFVNAGDSVEAGDLIGIIGNTGRSVGPHLHWEVWVNGIQVDPYEWVEKTFP
jgi:murein DD-endopeptidase MepM/ murein hydrolase activator NlpD